ncbi:MAG: SRPBCC family protein [Pseudomonadota bacterium]
MKTFFLALLALSLAAAPVQAGQPMPYPPAFPDHLTKIEVPLDMNLLKAGDLQISVEEFSPGGEGTRKRVVGVVLVDAPPDIVWNVLLDWETMHEFVPNLKSYKVVHEFPAPGNPGDLRKIIAGKIKVLFFTIGYSMDVLFDPENMRQEWRLVPDEEAEAYRDNGISATDPVFGLKSVEGFEYLEPFEGGKKTLYYYAPVIESSIPVPGFIERAMAKSSLRGYMKGVKEKAERLCPFDR